MCRWGSFFATEYGKITHCARFIISVNSWDNFFYIVLQTGVARVLVHYIIVFYPISCPSSAPARRETHIPLVAVALDALLLAFPLSPLSPFAASQTPPIPTVSLTPHPSQSTHLVLRRPPPLVCCRLVLSVLVDVGHSRVMIFWVLVQ